MYKAIIEITGDSKCAYGIIEDCFSIDARKANKTFRLLCKLPFSYKLGTAFCNADDISYGNMHHKLYWGRTKTLARGNEWCDFIMEIHK